MNRNAITKERLEWLETRVELLNKQLQRRREESIKIERKLNFINTLIQQANDKNNRE